MTQKKNEEEIWAKFKGRKNNNKILVEKAKALALAFVNMAPRVANDMVKEWSKIQSKKIENDKVDKIAYELLFFYLHLTDKQAFSCVDEEKRRIFMDFLIVETKETLSRTYESRVETILFREDFMKSYNERQMEYGKYEKEFPEKDEGFKDTLFWEFSKKISEILGAKMDIRAIILASDYVFNSLVSMKIPKLLKGE